MSRAHLTISDSGIATISLDHPPLNIYDLEMRDDLISAVTAVRDIPDVRALVLRAEGKHFSAGAELSEFASAPSIIEARRIRWDRDPWLPLLGLPVPTIAALHGYAVGSGLEMSLLCSLRIATPDTHLGLPETKLGMLPAAGGTQSLTRAIGPHAASPVVLTGETLDADRAFELGMVHEIVDDADRRALEIAETFATLDRELVVAMLRCIQVAGDLPLGQGLEMERALAAANDRR